MQSSKAYAIVAPGGKALVVFSDKTDAENYLVITMDALRGMGGAKKDAVLEIAEVQMYSRPIKQTRSPRKPKSAPAAEGASQNAS